MYKKFKHYYLIMIIVLSLPSRAPAGEVGESSGDSGLLDAFEEEAKREEFLRLTKNRLVEIISDERLTAPEDKVYEAVMRWVRYQDNSDGDRTAHLPDILQHVRFSQMNPSYLIGVSKDPLIKACNQCQEYVNEAKEMRVYERDDSESYSEARFKPRVTNYLFAVGGTINGQYASSVERYDTRTGEWTEVASMNRIRGRVGLAVLNNRLYAVGGGLKRSFLSSIECYDAHADKWTDNVKPLAHGGDTYNRVAALNGMLHFIGRLFVKYDANINEWIKCKPLRRRRRGYAVGVLNGHIYVLGGLTKQHLENTVERYDSTQNEWYNVSPMITKRSDFGVAANRGYLYAVGGRGDSWEALNSVEWYDPHTDRWGLISPMNEHRYRLGLAVANGLIYAAGGLDSNDNNLNTVEVYDPSTNTWSGRAPLLHARNHFGLAAMKH